MIHARHFFFFHSNFFIEQLPERTIYIRIDAIELIFPVVRPSAHFPFHNNTSFQSGRI